MDAAVIVFPGSNCDRDMAVALEQALGRPPHMVWHKDADLPRVDLIALPGGFSHGDYLRCGAIAAQAPILREVVRRAEAGVRILGVCNGFQVLTEAGLLPGALMRNADLHFVCRTVDLAVATTDSVFTAGWAERATVSLPIAHHDGNYSADADTLKALADADQIALRYVDNPNGSADDIAGILNDRRNVLGMMPHPERAVEPAHGNTDGQALFTSLVEALA